MMLREDCRRRLDAGEAVTIPASAGKILFLQAVCALCVGIGLWFVLDGFWGGWIAVGVFGPGLVFFRLLMRPGASEVRIDAEGFESKCLWNREGYRWGEIERIDTIRPMHSFGRQQRQVGITLKPEAQLGKHKLAATLSGYHVRLPGNYVLPPEDVTELMEHAREAATGERTEEIPNPLQSRY